MTSQLNLDDTLFGQGPPVYDPPITEARQVDGGKSAIQQQLGHGQPDRGGVHQAVAGKAAGHVEVLEPAHPRADDRVDPAETALVRQARAVLDEARLTRDRMIQLWEQKFIARAQVDAAIAGLEVAEGRIQDAVEEVRNRQAVLVQRRTEVEITRQQLADTVLASPIDGAVSQRQASVGEYLSPGTAVVTVVRVHPLRLRLAVPERESGSVRVGQTVRVTVEGDATVYAGRVARLSPAIQEQSRTLMIEAEVPNEPGRLRPGAFAKTEIVTQAGRRVVMVPASSIIVFAGIEKVITVRDGRAGETRVRTGRRDGDRVEIAEGLAAGEPVVVQPGNLTGGQPVTIVP